MEPHPKAIVLNLLSLTATFGAMVWTFQQGNLSGLLGFTATGTLTTPMLILMFCIAFGLSMDYEVFLLSRITEEHDRTGNNHTAVATGADRHGGRRAAWDRVHRLCHLRDHLHQDARRRHGAGGHRGRHPDPRRAGAGVHAPGRQRQLVGPGAAAAGSVGAA